MLRESMLRKAAMAVALWATVPLASVAQAADSFSYLGTTIGRPTFNRPDLGDPPFSLSGQLVRFHARQFFVDTRTNCTVDSSQNGTSAIAFDGVIHVYKGSFNPSDPVRNVIAGNDNFFEETESVAENFRIQLEVEPRIPHFIVTSAVAPQTRSDSLGRIRVGAGDFQNTVSCDSSPVFLSSDLSVPQGERVSDAVDKSNCAVFKGQSTCKGGLLGNRFQVAAQLASRAPGSRPDFR